jgi:hypothetical protein
MPKGQAANALESSRPLPLRIKPGTPNVHPSTCTSVVFGAGRSGRTRACGLLLPNGSALDGSTSQLLEPQQHGEHSFELAVEMHLVTTKPLQPVWVGPLRAATERFGAKLDALHKDHKAEIIRLKLQR